MKFCVRTKQLGMVLYLLTILSGGLTVGGCGGQPQAASAPPLPEVATVTVQPQSVLLTTELPGRTSAFLAAEIRPQVNGLIRKRLFEEGSDVKAGQGLYEIEPAPFQAALNNALAALGRAEAYLPPIRSRADRYRELLVEKAVSSQDYDDAAAALKQAEADIEYWKATVETARINLGYTRINAPIPGRIGKSSVTDGALVTAYQPMALAAVQQIDPIYVDVIQSTADLLKLKRHMEEGRLDADGNGQNKVRLILDDGTIYPLEGTLQFRDVTVDPTTGSVILRLVFPNPEGLLLPGMFVRAIIKEGVNREALLIPQQAVSRDPRGNPLALVVNGEGKVEQRKINLGRAIGDKWLVSSGLKPGERVIVEGLQKVRAGASVKEVSFDGGGKTDGEAGKKAQPAPESN